MFGRLVVGYDRRHVTAEIIVAVVAVVVVVLTAWVLVRQPNPEEAADHEPTASPPRGPTEEGYPSGSRPAGPGAESQDPDAGFEEVEGRSASHDDR